MKTNVETSVTYTLILDKEEAEWLHNVMQNPLHNQHPIAEATYDRDMRIQFFEATKPKL